MSQQALRTKLVWKYSVAVLLLAYVFLFVCLQTLGALARLIHFDIGFVAQVRKLSAGEYLVWGILFAVFSVIGFAFLRDARKLSKELGDPDPAPLGDPPENQPRAYPTEFDQSNRQIESGQYFGTFLTWTGHAIVVVTLGLIAYSVLTFRQEAGGIGLGFPLAFIFYVAGAANRR